MSSESIPQLGEGHEPAWSLRAVEDEAEEGLLLAEYATRMRLKNRIIVDTMSATGVIDPQDWADEARLALGRLRIEAEASAKRMGQQREVAAATDGRAEHEHDYRAGDADNLDRRARVYRMVARQLLSWENSEAQVAALLEAARRDAAEEMDAALVAAVSGDGTARVEDPALLRERRRQIVEVDLPALQRAREPLAVHLPPMPGAAPTAPTTAASRPGVFGRLIRRIGPLLRRRAAGKGVRPPR